ncbi:DUF2330 domain-containing protein [Mycobacterium sp. Aquia_213]|uniref:DUF2330 domain-containing protein n=1 Tax=Mycobacterium sp. Aquia_213 TaxID=2991728 RepID=UPI00226E2700|nr:DUF2330 domain-containing protein [Mycobacterium sp. Aquia_213]WAC91907.1 DUF2330 domain-containing protein [Mycobacterium sp. Aquia_213]
MKMPRTCGLGLVAVVLATLANVAMAAPGHACACGAIVPPVGGQAAMNHEVALLHWNGSSETIVMQLALNADTNNVALVVPTPTPATVTEGDKATFAELDTLTAPRVQQRRHWVLGQPGSGAPAPLEAAAPRGPTVVNQVHLGPLEATTLAGGDLSGLQKWLDDNGYAIRPAVSDALGPYVRDGWSFVAIRLTSSDPIVGGLNPVRMTFPSTQLVYPMRLSVAAASPQQVTIFTLSDHRQQRTDADAAAGQSVQVQFAGNVSAEVRDPLLRELSVNHGGYLTKFQVNIPKPAQISSDFAFGNAANDDAYRQVIYVDRNAVIPIELIVFVGFLFVVIAVAVPVAIFAVRRRRQRASTLR